MEYIIAEESFSIYQKYSPTTLKYKSVTNAKIASNPELKRWDSLEMKKDAVLDRECSERVICAEFFDNVHSAPNA